MCHKFKLIIMALSFLSGCAQEAVKVAVEPEKPVDRVAESDKLVYNKALWAIKEKRFSEAQVILDGLIKKYPEASGPLANMGVVFTKTNKPEKAEEYFHKAVSKNEKLVQARNYLAVLYRKKGEFTEARDMLDAAIAIDPYYANAYYNLGILYELYLQKPEKALENYQLYLDLKKGGDKQVSRWVSLLQRQIKASNR